MIEEKLMDMEGGEDIATSGIPEDEMVPDTPPSEAETVAPAPVDTNVGQG